ncbi:MAG TPA: VOC family protein [Dehalococcoidia bacterium]|nr:VOC family protein [Dehalococcoidia bacterium]
MLGPSKLVTFVLTARPGEARRFYEEVLGFRFVAEDDFAIVFEMNGTTLRLTKMEQVEPAPHTILGLDADDIARGMSWLEGRGVRFERYEGMGQDERGVWSAGPVKVAWFKDPDGNLLSISQGAAV